MADVAMKMPGEGDSTAKCREARRRRVEMRRFTAATVGDQTPPQPPEKRLKAEEEETGSGSGKRSRKAEEADLSGPGPPPPSSSATPSTSSSSSSSGEFAAAIASTSGEARAVDPPVAFGSVSLTGRSREMEDAVSVQPAFFRPSDGGSPLHFFAVFDGHGGSHVSALCKEQMHVLLAEELATATATAAASLSSRAAATEAEKYQGWRAAVARCFARMDELALSSCACGRVGPPPCACERAGIESEIVGSTAVVAVLAPGRLLVANCGDSRAVLSRAGRAVPLSADHKPDRPDELARIEAAGGRVIYLNGARVHGILAMSRALGDKYLKPVVISEPEIRMVERTAEDECLIIASDGLWDVLSNDLACDVARRCLEEADPARGAEEIDSRRGTEAAVASDQEHEQASEPRCSLAAALLARLALGRKSADNISVIVIDLRRR